MKVTIITVVYDNFKYIRDSIESAISQNYPLIEYIVIDGGSSDGTLGIIEEYRDRISVLVSESDAGIYDALNKGIRMATGDVVAILHSDDLFFDEFVVSDMVKKMSDTKSEFCFSDMVIVDKMSDKVQRYYMANYFSRWMFRMGWMPPHPTCFIKKALFDEFGLYSIDYQLAGDFELMVRIFYSRDIRWTYLNRVTVRMRNGGASNSGISSKIVCANEINRSLRSNHIWSLPIFQLGRYLIRILELIVRPKAS
jgi:glycosyltransferase involved in cell wall biosynthesis